MVVSTHGNIVLRVFVRALYTEVIVPLAQNDSMYVHLHMLPHQCALFVLQLKLFAVSVDDIDGLDHCLDDFSLSPLPPAYPCSA